MARVYQPNGPGPFPTVLDLHGGAWNAKDRKAEEPMDRAIAASGVLVVAIDLTLAPPWHQAEVHWHWSHDSLPADVDFTLAFGDGLLEPGATLSGDIDLTVAARHQP